MESLYINASPFRIKWYCSRERYAESRNELLQSWLHERWWANSMECYCFLRNVQDPQGEGITPYGRRFGEPFKGPIILFGAMVEYHPFSTRDQSRLHQFGKKVWYQVSFLNMEANLDRRNFGCGFGRFWKSWTHQKLILEESTRKKDW